MVIEVENIKCGGCATSIKNAIGKFNGVINVDVDLLKEQISIETNEPFDFTPILNKLAQMGYPQKGNNHLQAKAKSYVSCMIGRLENIKKA